MAHSHAHGESDGNYFLDQLFTILICGAIGIVAILLYGTKLLDRILVPEFHPWVMVGGGVIALLVVVRAVAVWQIAGARKPAVADAAKPDDHADCGHDHGHAHGEHADCGHDHSHSHAHAHAHGEGDTEDDHHDHSWAPWRYMVLAVPVFLYFLELPREAYSKDQLEKIARGGSLNDPKREALSLLVGGIGKTKALRKTQPLERILQFKELPNVAARPSVHDEYIGDIGKVRGQFYPVKAGSGNEFTLFRMNMTCCAADAVMLKVRIVAPEPLQGVQSGEWVEVRGTISFQKSPDGKEWVPVITLASNDDVIIGVDATADTEGT
jgi:hypothetical protein